MQNAEQENREYRESQKNQQKNRKRLSTKGG